MRHEVREFVDFLILFLRGLALGKFGFTFVASSLDFGFCNVVVLLSAEYFSEEANGLGGFFGRQLFQ